VFLWLFRWLFCVLLVARFVCPGYVAFVWFVIVTCMYCLGSLRFVLLGLFLLFDVWFDWFVLLFMVLLW